MKDSSLVSKRFIKAFIWHALDRPVLPCADPNDVLQCGDEHLSIADDSGARRFDDCVDGAVDELVRDGHGYQHLGYEVDLILRASIDLGMALLAAEAFGFYGCQAGHTEGDQSSFEFVQLVGPDHGVNTLHRSRTPSGRSAEAALNVSREP